MLAHMRNKRTGEIRPVDLDSSEFLDMQAEVDYNGQTKWEQTSLHHAAAVQDRQENDAQTEFDLGKNDQPAPVTVHSLEGVGPEKEPWLSLTVGEVEAGLSPEEKKAQIEENQERQSRNVRDDRDDRDDEVDAATDEEADKPTRRSRPKVTVPPKADSAPEDTTAGKTE